MLEYYSRKEIRSDFSSALQNVTFTNRIVFEVFFLKINFNYYLLHVFY